MAVKTMDMTTGKPLPLLVKFALPLMAGQIFQQMYTMMDTAIVGNGVGVEALASLGAADWLNWMMLGLATGFSQGFAILISQAFGAKDQKRLQQAVMIALKLGVLLAFLMTVLGELMVRPILRCLATPENVIGGSLAYLRIMFGGVILTMLYNLFAAILRSFGNSQTPLWAMVIGSLLNIVLDVLFVFYFSWGIQGAAFATIIAQGVAAAFCLKDLYHLPMLDFRLLAVTWDHGTARYLLKLGCPVAFQNMIISVGGLVVQAVVNGCGLIFIAGFTATNKLYGLLEFAAIAYGYAVASYAGQNLGAGRLDRVRLGVKQAIWLGLGTAAAVSVLMIGLGQRILSLFVSAEAAGKAEVLGVAYTYLCIMAFFLGILFLLHLYRSSLQGLGNTIIPFYSGLVELAMRVAAALFLPLFIGEIGIFFAEIAAWSGAAFLLGIGYHRTLGALMKNHSSSYLF